MTIEIDNIFDKDHPIVANDIKHNSCTHLQ